MRPEVLNTSALTEEAELIASVSVTGEWRRDHGGLSLQQQRCENNPRVSALVLLVCVLLQCDVMENTLLTQINHS